jgi:hypothetical protein
MISAEFNSKKPANRPAEPSLDILLTFLTFSLTYLLQCSGCKFLQLSFEKCRKEDGRKQGDISRSIVEKGDKNSITLN